MAHRFHMCFTSLGGAIARSFDKGLSAFWWLSCFKSLTLILSYRTLKTHRKGPPTKAISSLPAWALLMGRHHLLLLLLSSLLGLFRHLGLLL